MEFLKIKSADGIADFLHTWYRMLPQLSKTSKRICANIFPYVILIIGTLFIADVITHITTLAFQISIVPRAEYELLMVNNVLLNIFYILSGIILLSSFNPLSLSEQRGWRTAFYVSLTYAIIGLIFFNIIMILGLLIFWYFLFAVREEYT